MPGRFRLLLEEIFAGDTSPDAAEIIDRLSQRITFGEFIDLLGDAGFSNLLRGRIDRLRAEARRIDAWLQRQVS